MYSKISEIIPVNYGKVSNKSVLHQKTYTTPNNKSSNGFPMLDVPAYLNAWGGEWRIKQKGAVTWFQFRICPLHKDYDGDEWECGICQFPNGKMGARCMHDQSFGWHDFKEVLGNTRPFYLGHKKAILPIT